MAPPILKQRQALVAFTIDHASVSANAAIKFCTLPADADFVSAEVINPTGLAADPANYFAIAIKAGATVMAQTSTQTAAQGALVADTPKALIKSAVAGAARGAAGAVLSLALTNTGTQTLPIGKVVVWLRLRGEV